MTTLDILKKTRAARSSLAALDETAKNRILLAMAEALMAAEDDILAENDADMTAARGHINDVMLDRLRLDHDRLAGMAEGVRAIAALPDHTGRVLSEVHRPNGLVVRKVQVPLGLVSIIYESRPNVTSDAAALAVKSGNVCVLRSGKEAHRSACAIVKALKSGIAQGGGDPEILNIVDDTTHQSAADIMTAKGLVDLLIPRGGAGLIQAVLRQSTVPVIETGAGNCHVYVDSCLHGEADYEMAVRIIDNAKTQRPSVCNAIEGLIVHQDVAAEILPRVQAAFRTHDVTIYGDEQTRKILGDAVQPVTEELYDTEFNDYKITVKVVASLDEAMAHIAKYSTKHSECIITRDLDAAQKFQRTVDAAVVYVNASTRFTDGGEFGYGAEIGISTQKLHARGPMGLHELTTVKYLVSGNGQIRE